MDETVYKIAIAGYLHGIGKFAEKAVYAFTAKSVAVHENSYIINIVFIDARLIGITLKNIIYLIKISCGLYDKAYKKLASTTPQ